MISRRHAVRWADILLIGLMVASPLASQTSPAALLITRIYNITSAWTGECAAGIIDNRSQHTRRNNYHAIYATGAGSWTAAINYSDTSCSGPWTTFGSASAITQASNPAIAYANGYHPYIQIIVTGNAVVTYSAAKDFFLSTAVGSMTFPLTVAQGGTGGSALTLNGFLFGNGTSGVQATVAGTQYQVAQAGAAGVPVLGPVHLDQAAAVTGVLPKGNETMPAWADITGTKQGNTNVPQMAGTNSGVSGALHCNDASGNTTTAGCSTTSFILNSNDYIFSAQTCNSSNVCSVGGTSGASLVIGNNSITMTPVPVGVNGTDSVHYMYVSGGTGTAEPCLITGGSGTSGQASGSVIINCGHTHSGGFTVGPASGGIREALSLMVAGRASIYVPAGAITVHGQIYIPPGVSLHLEVDADLTFGADIGANDGIWMDSCEACTIHFTGSVYYQGSNYGVRLNPKNPAPADNIKNIQWSDIQFNNIQAYPPGGNTGSGVPIAKSLVRVLLEGDVASPIQGLVAHNHFTFSSLWGGLSSILVDTAATAYFGGAEENHWDVDQVVFFTQQSIRACTTNTGPVCTNGVWHVNVLYGRDDGSGTAPQAGLDTGKNQVGGIWDIASLSQPSGKNSINFGSGSSHVQVRTAGVPGGTITDNSGNGTNSVTSNMGLLYPSVPLKTNITASGSPYVCQNKTYRPMQITVTGGTTSAFEVSVDGSSYSAFAKPDQIPFMLLPGMYSRTTYSVIPTIFIYCGPGSTLGCQCN